MVKAWCYILLYEMIMFFLKLSATGRSPMVVSLLHKMQVPNNCFTLSLYDSNSCKSNSWCDDHVTTHWYRSRWWRSWCRAGNDRDHDSTLEMEIKGARWSWPYHVTYFDCIWCLSIIHLILALIDGSILRWSLTNYQEVFSLSMHRCESSSCWDTTWWSGVRGSTFKYNGCKTVAHAEYSG